MSGSIELPPAGRPSYLHERSSSIRRTVPWAPFAQVTRLLRSLLVDLTGGVGPLTGQRVLDFGSADSPYRDLFLDAEYVAADLPGNDLAEVEVRADGTLPIEDSSFDLVFSSQVLEHVSDPGVYLTECHRVLRPGGQLVLSTHGIMFLHRDPTDHWRWTGDGLVLATERAGFEVVELRGVLGLVGSSLQLLQEGVTRSLPRPLRKPVIVVFQLMVGVAERITSDRSRTENGLVLGIRAVKPARPSLRP